MPVEYVMDRSAGGNVNRRPTTEDPFDNKVLSFGLLHLLWLLIFHIEIRCERQSCLLFRVRLLVQNGPILGGDGGVAVPIFLTLWRHVEGHQAGGRFILEQCFDWSAFHYLLLVYRKWRSIRAEELIVEKIGTNTFLSSGTRLCLRSLCTLQSKDGHSVIHYLAKHYRLRFYLLSFWPRSRSTQF